MDELKSKILKHKIGLITLIVISLLIFVSWASNYSLISPFEVNFEIANMLTPYGLIVNYYFGDTYLTPYFKTEPLRQELAGNVKLYLSLFLLEVSTLVLIRLVKKKFDEHIKGGK